MKRRIIQAVKKAGIAAEVDHVAGKRGEYLVTAQGVAAYELWQALGEDIQDVDAIGWGVFKVVVK